MLSIQHKNKSFQFNHDWLLYNVFLYNFKFEFHGKIICGLHLLKVGRFENAIP